MGCRLFGGEGFGEMQNLTLTCYLVYFGDLIWVKHGACWPTNTGAAG